MSAKQGNGRAAFPSVAWFQKLAERMTAQPEKYTKLGTIDITLVPSITFPDGHKELYRLVFQRYGCEQVEQPASTAAIRGPHPVIVEGDYAAWKEMIESIQRNGHADLQHTLNYLTLPDWPLRLVAADEGEGQLDVDRFYRYNQTLQEFFDEAAAVDTEFRL
jgi:hypothetical protein